MRIFGRRFNLFESQPPFTGEVSHRSSRISREKPTYISARLGNHNLVRNTLLEWQGSDVLTMAICRYGLGHHTLGLLLTKSKDGDWGSENAQFAELQCSVTSHIHMPVFANHVELDIRMNQTDTTDWFFEIYDTEGRVQIRCAKLVLKLDVTIEEVALPYPEW